MFKKTVFFSLLLLSLPVFISNNGYCAQIGRVREVLFYKELLQSTCKLQIEYYKEFIKYLEETNAKKKPKLLRLFLGLSQFELGEVKAADKNFSVFIAKYKKSVPDELRDFLILAKTMRKVISLRDGGKGDFTIFCREILKTAGISKKAEALVAYSLLRFGGNRELAVKLLGAHKKGLLGEVKEKWIQYTLGGGKKQVFVPYRLKKPDYTEEYDRIKLKREEIPLLVKYFDPANTALLLEMSISRAKAGLKAKNINNALPLARLEILAGNAVNSDKALNYIKRFLEFNPGSSDARMYLGKVYFLRRNFDAASDSWQYVKENGTKDTLRHLAVMLAGFGKTKEALKLMEQTKEAGMTKNPPGDIRYFIRYKGYYNSLGELYLKAEEYGKAGKTLMLAYQRSMAGNSRFFQRDYLIKLGLSLAKSGRYKDAIKFAFKGLSTVEPGSYPCFHAVNFGLYMLKYE